MGTTANGETVATTGTTTLGNTTGSPAVQQTGKIVKGGGAGMSSAAKKDSVAACTKEGHPVDVVTGEVVDELLELFTPGLFDVEWKRTYSSGFADEATPLGRGGWTFTLHQWIETDHGFPSMRDADGRNVGFAPPDDTGRSFFRAKRLELFARGAHFEVWSIIDQKLRVFAPALPGGRSLLREIRDARGNAVLLEYDVERLVKVTDTAGREYRLRHDHVGRIVEVAIWARGVQHQTVHYTYTDAGELASASDALGQTHRYAYDAWHRLVQTTLPNGTSFYYEYDQDSGRCTKTWGDGGLFTVVFDYDLDAGTTITSGNPSPKRYVYGPKNEILVESTLDESVVWERDYDDDLFVVAERNGAGDEIKYEYDARGNRVAKTDALGNVTRYEYVADWVTRIIHPDGNVTIHERNRFGECEGIIIPSGAWTRSTYDGKGRIVQVYGPEGELAYSEYDAEHNRILMRNFRGGTRRYTHDALGRETSRTDALGRVSRAEYDAIGQPTTVIGRDGGRTDLAWDPLGYLLRQTNSVGQTTTFEYAGYGALLSVTKPDGQAYTFTYDKNQRLVEMRNPKQERLEYRYDQAGRVEEERTFDGRVLRYTYDAGNRLASMEQADGTFVRWAYAPDGQVVEETSAHATVTWEHDDFGRLVAATVDEDAAQIACTYEYDELGRIVRETQNGHVIERELHEQGWMKRRTVDGVETTYSYSPYGELESVQHDGFDLRLQRDVLGREVRRFTSSGQFDIQYRYGLRDETVAQRVLVPSKQAPGQFDELFSQHWEYDAQGHMIRATDSRQPPGSYSLDADDRIVSFMKGPRQEIYEYDAAGALLARVDAIAKRGGPWKGRTGGVIVTTDTTEYRHDEQGRRVSAVELDAEGDATGPETEYVWDARGNLREVRKPDGERVRFFYDALRRRVRKEVHPALPTDGSAPKGSHVVEFVWDHNQLCSEIDAVRGRRFHVLRPGSFEPLLQAQDGAVYAVVTDYLGAVRDLLDANGRVAWSVDMAPWGEASPLRADPHATGAGRVESPFRGPGQYWDDEIGLAYAWYRYWDPATGRFLSPDPLGINGGLNLFGLDASPTEAVDPTGLAEPYDIGTYSGQNRKRPVDHPTNPGDIGDGLQADEMLTHAFLKHNKGNHVDPDNMGASRGVGSTSANNPTIALPNEVHKQVTAAEAAANLHDEATLKSMTAEDMIREKAKILRKVLKDNNVPDAEAKVRKLIKAAVAHAKSVLNPCKWGNLDLKNLFKK